MIHAGKEYSDKELKTKKVVKKRDKQSSPLGGGLTEREVSTHSFEHALFIMHESTMSAHSLLSALCCEEKADSITWRHC